MGSVAAANGSVTSGIWDFCVLAAGGKTWPCQPPLPKHKPWEDRAPPGMFAEAPPATGTGPGTQ